MNFLKRYARWLHTQWPAGRVEKLPVTNDDGATNVAGVYVVGDLRGVPLLKFAVDGGARAVHHIVADRAFQDLRSQKRDGDVVDVAIVGGGVAGMAAAIEAKVSGLSFTVFESSEPFSTIVNFPKGKPIYTYPKEMAPAGEFEVSADIKEDLVGELLEQTRARGIEPVLARVEYVRPAGQYVELKIAEGDRLLARRVVLALGRSGNFRGLGVPGEDMDKVYNRLHDPADFCGQNTLVVGGGDSALETAIALAECGSGVTLSYRGKQLSRPKPENVEKLLAGTTDVVTESTVREIREKDVVVEDSDGRSKTLPNDVVFTMIGREPPLDFFRRSGIRISGEWTKKAVLSFAGFFLFCIALYNWKSGGSLGSLFYQNNWFPVSLRTTFAEAASNPSSFLGVLVISASGPAFWYTLAYCVLVVTFGIRRIKRRQTPYVTVQTLTLMTIQVLPLFLLPEIILPLLDKNGLLWQPLADGLFPIVNYDHGREFWRAYGLILAWPLNVYNVLTDSPIAWWLVISFVQTFVLIPAIIYFWGKGAYCGWICSCGALAETLGDNQRHKMPHGPAWNRLNMVGQVILLIAFLILLVRVYGWIFPNPMLDSLSLGSKDKYKWIVDVFLAGVVGYGTYFWFSGRVWCRFLCPLAALMHVFARFSRFRILADKKKCISCNVCTSVCHQGIDIMSFANKGLPMEDPECVRCSACVQSCPTGVLTFGQVDRRGNVISTDRLAASPVQMREQE
jgi:thioredoxin reductase/ferredoxin